MELANPTQANIIFIVVIDAICIFGPYIEFSRMIQTLEKHTGQNLLYSSNILYTHKYKTNEITKTDQTTVFQ